MRPRARGMGIVGTKHHLVYIENAARHFDSDRVIDETDPDLTVEVLAREQLWEGNWSVAGESAAVSRPLIPMTGLIFTGVLDRHPRLTNVMAEAGLAGVPSMMQGLDIWYQRTRDGRRLTGDAPITLPQLLPSEYFHRQIWISFVDDPIGVKMAGSILDVDKVMFGSDYPHPASTWPHSQQIIEEQGLSPHVRQKIFRDNACALFRL